MAVKISIDEKKYIEASRKIKNLDLDVNCPEFSVKIFDFKFLEYSRKNKRRKLYARDHAHSFCELQVMIRGNNTYLTDSGEIYVSEGEFVLFSPGTTHRLISFTDEFSKISLCFSVEFPETSELVFLGEKLHASSAFSGETDFSFMNPIEFLFEYAERGENVAGIKILRWQLQTLITVVLDCCFGLKKEISAAVSEENATVDRDFYNMVLGYIRENLSGKNIVADLSKDAFMSERQIRRRLIKCCGKTPRQLIDQLRYEKIKELLLNDVPITDICERAGFSEAASLNRFFKRMEGMTPGQYRDQLTILNYQ